MILSRQSLEKLSNELAADFLRTSSPKTTNILIQATPTFNRHLPRAKNDCDTAVLDREMSVTLEEIDVLKKPAKNKPN